MSKYAFHQYVDLSPLGEEYKGIDLKFKKPHLIKHILELQKQSHDEPKALESSIKLIEELYVGEDPTLQELQENFYTADVISMIIKSFAFTEVQPVGLVQQTKEN